MIAQVSKVVFGLLSFVIVTGLVYLAFQFGRGGLPAPAVATPTAIAERQPTPTRFVSDDRGRDTGRQYATSVPANNPLNLATAEAYSLSVYATAVAGAEYPAPSPAITWADALPDCSSGQTPCTFTYSSGPPAPVQPNLATGGVNTGSDGHPQKDADLAADPWGGDKP